MFTVQLHTARQESTNTAINSQHHNIKSQEVQHMDINETHSKSVTQRWHYPLNQ